MKLVIPKKESLIKTNIEDSLEFYYKPFFSYIYRKKLKMCADLLGNLKFKRVLDAGYGTGIFFFTLNKISKEIYGIDEHDKHEAVMEKIGKSGIDLKLKKGDISKPLPYKDKTFDCIVTISALEHIKDLDKLIDEFDRVLKKDGYLIAGFPVKNKITDSFFKLIEPFWEEKIDIVNGFHVSSHKDIIKAIGKRFKIQKIKKLPFFLPIDISSYISIKAKKI